MPVAIQLMRYVESRIKGVGSGIIASGSGIRSHGIGISSVSSDQGSGCAILVGSEMKKHSSLQPCHDSCWEVLFENFVFYFLCSGTTTSLFGYKLTTPEAVASLIRLKKDIHMLPKMV